jgi:hypothetical protein
MAEATQKPAGSAADQVKSIVDTHGQVKEIKKDRRAYPRRIARAQEEVH